MLPWFQYLSYGLGPLTIQVWGSFVALGMFLGLYIVHQRAKKKGLEPQILVDAGLWMIIGGLVGARIFHVLFYEPGLYISHPFEIIRIWHGGMSSYGSFFGAGLALFLFVKKRKLSKALIFQSIDIFAYGALFGWILGRVGCFMIHDHLGKPCNCFLAIQTPDGPRLEMALLEILGLIPLAVFFFVLRKKKKVQGWFAAVLFAYYGILRFILDFFRASPADANITSSFYIPTDARYLGLTPAQYFSILSFAVAVYLLLKMRKQETSFKD
ncbi:MAG: prolipoprotein diacylglyceryl transferase [Candidatus Magasanikbacteria bacterium]|nr:prolipoprotein diacylglyceryl transferase [Candidatus Magasanikbacteria bacterium]